jgi:hypothetical protein
MHRRLLNRALVALAVPALVVPALVAPATAAGKGPGVPAIPAVAKIYPHLKGGHATVTAQPKIFGPGKKCKQGKVIKGASGRMATYLAPFNTNDPDAFAMTGRKPSLYVSALKFPTAKSAVRYLHGWSTSTKKCPVSGAGGGTGGPKVKITMKKIRFTLGNERWGYQVKVVTKQLTTISNTLFVRKGRYVVYTGATSMDGVAPSIPKSVQFTKTALRAAG